MEHLLDEVSSALDRIRSRVVGDIESQLDAVMSKGEGQARRLEMELSQLMERRATLEVQAISQDHIGFLQVRPGLLAVARACSRDIITSALLRVTKMPPLPWRRSSRTTGTRSSRCTSSWGT